MPVKVIDVTDIKNTEGEKTGVKEELCSKEWNTYPEITVSYKPLKPVKAITKTAKPTETVKEETKPVEDHLFAQDLWKACGWQGGTIHQVIEEIYRLKTIEKELNELKLKLIDSHIKNPATAHVKAIPGTAQEIMGNIIILNFANIPDDTTRKEMKKVGFKWNSKDKIWIADKTTESENIANLIMGV